MEKVNENVQVVVRCRPMNDKELAMNYTNVVRIDTTRKCVEIDDPKNEKGDFCKVFTFDGAFDVHSRQGDIYDQMVRPLVNEVLCGFNGTVFAYGQSGAGKTYTMEGTASGGSKGVLPRTFEHIFDHISKSCNMQYLVRTSFIEIYQDEIKDLMDPRSGKKYELRENKNSGVYVKDISSFVCKSEKEMNMIINAGRRNRTIASTNVNDKSSRSHSIVIITIEMKDITGSFEGRVRIGKLNIVDLAGSERQNKTNAEGTRLKEANKINLSLSALGNVISALSENKGYYIPYRDSKLTRILRDSLGGNSKTLMIANIGPASYNYDESLNTLRYASRAKNIRNLPKVNEDPVDNLIKKYQEEIKRLKSKLQERTAVKICPSAKAEESDSIVGNENSKTVNCTTKCLTNDSSISNEEANCNIKTKTEQDECVKELIKRIELMESRLLGGTENIIEHTSEQKKMLEVQTHELIKIKQREKEMQECLEKETEVAEVIKEDHSNLEQEVEMKSKKLGKMYLKLKAKLQEIQDAKDEFNADRRELETVQREILKELKLRFLIMEHFIPRDQRRRILPRLHYHDEQECWQLKPENEPTQTLRKPKCVKYMRRPLTLYSAFTRRKANHLYRCNRTEENRQNTFRFKGEDILELDLIQSKRTTKDYKPPELPSALSSMFQTALEQEEDIDIDASSISSRHRGVCKKSGRSLESVLKEGCHIEEPRRTYSNISLPEYPKPRGLVPK